MEPPSIRCDDTVEDGLDLRRYLRDLVALSTLPALWVGKPPQVILEGVADALVRTLPADFVYTRLEPPSERGDVVETCTTNGAHVQFGARAIGRSLDHWLDSYERVHVLSVPNPIGEGDIGLAVVPVGHAGSTLGAIAAGARHPDFPSRYDVLLMNVVANHAAVALQSEQLRVAQDRVGERTRHLESLYRADETLHRSLRLEDVLQALVDVAVDVLGVDKAAVLVREPGASRLMLRASRGFPRDGLFQFTAGPDEGFSGLAFRSGEAIGVADYAADPRAGPLYVEFSRAFGVQAQMSVPIVASGEVFAIFNVFFAQRHEFGEEERRLIMALAQRAGLAIENARLYEAARGRAALEERQKLARELHDSVSQALYAIGLNASSAAELLSSAPGQARDLVGDVVRLAEAGLAEMRALIFELRPESLESEGLAASVEKQVAAFQARHELVVRTRLGPEPDVPLATKEAVYRIVQEALQNIARHARARTVELVLGEHRDLHEHREHREHRALLELNISDDGQGFDPSATFAGHLGLRSMRERAAAVGGSLDIQSSPGRGTQLRLQVPITPRAQPALATLAAFRRDAQRTDSAARCRQ